MADKVGEMAVSERPNSPNPFFSFFQNLVKNLPLPLPKFEEKQGVVDGGQKGQVEMEGEGEMVSKKVDVVRFSEKRPIVPPPLKLEAEEESESHSSPTVLWQVYALGGFVILRWAWARWNERSKKKNGGSDEEEETYLAED